MNEVFDPAFAAEIFPSLLQGMATTLEITALGFLFAAVLGFFIFLARRAQTSVHAKVIGAGVDLIRSTPLLVQLYFAYFVLPDAGVDLSPIVAGTLVLGLHYACYTSEVYRASYMRIAVGQHEAARSLAFSKVMTLRLIVVPQMLPVLIPGLGNYLIVIFKETPALSAITVMEMLSTAKIIGAENFRYLEPMTIAGCLFLAISIVFSWVFKKLEARLQWHHSR